MAKKIQSKISYWCMLRSFGSTARAIYGCHAPKLQACLHVQLTARLVEHATVWPKSSPDLAFLSPHVGYGMKRSFRVAVSPTCSASCPLCDKPTGEGRRRLCVTDKTDQAMRKSGWSAWRAAYSSEAVMSPACGRDGFARTFPGWRRQSADPAHPDADAPGAKAWPAATLLWIDGDAARFAHRGRLGLWPISAGAGQAGWLVRSSRA